MKQGNLSCIRLIAMLMIISCHILQGLHLEAAFWLNLGVQVFFVLSGYLYSRKKISSAKEFYIKQYKKIIIPYLVICIIMFILNYCNGYTTFNKFTTLGGFLGFQGWIGSIRNMSHTWFVSYILLCYLITPLLEKTINKQSTRKSFTQLFLLTVCLQLFNSYGILNINVSYLMLYMFGYYYGNIEKNMKNDFKITMFFIVLTLLLFPPRLLVQYHNNALIIKYLKYFNISIGNFTSYHHAFCGIVIFFLIKNIFKKVKHNKVLAFSDKYSYYVYLVHQIFILNDFSLLHKTNSLIINICLILFCTIISGILLEKITEKILEIINKIQNKKAIKMKG